MDSRRSELEPRLWREDAPWHFDLRIPAWVKLLLLAAAVIVAIYCVDGAVAAWTLRTHPIPDLVDVNARHGDIGREMMWLEQWGQGVCSVVVILAVALLDPKGRRRALAIAIGCGVTLALTHLLKDAIGRSRPFVSGDGSWVWGGPAAGFMKGSSWGSFPSAHTTAAFALACGLAWFYPRGRGLFMTLALITAAQRVLHSAHFVSDTIAGLAIGVLITRATLKTNIAGWLIHVAPPPVQRWWLQG